MPTSSVGASRHSRHSRPAQIVCEWLHVDFDDHLRPLYFDACGFTPNQAGLVALQDDPT